jgi:hypothetical protein
LIDEEGLREWGFRRGPRYVMNERCGLDASRYPARAPGLAANAARLLNSGRAKGRLGALA